LFAAFLIDQEVPEYDMDSEDEIWVKEQQSRRVDITPDKVVNLKNLLYKKSLSVLEQFEEMMDRLEKGCGQTALELKEAKTLLKEDDDLIIAVYDYWLNKRVKMVKSPSHLKNRSLTSAVFRRTLLFRKLKRRRECLVQRPTTLT